MHHTRKSVTQKNILKFSLHENFEKLFENIEEELFTRSTVKVTQDSADYDFHHGEIGIKAHNIISRVINNILIMPVNLEDEDLSMNAFMTIPLFKGLYTPVNTYFAAFINSGSLRFALFIQQFKSITKKYKDLKADFNIMTSVERKYIAHLNRLKSLKNHTKK